MVGYRQRGDNHPAIPHLPSRLLCREREGGLDSESTHTDVENLDGGIDPVVAASLKDADKEQRANHFSCI
jgi:hypothetical protein